MFMTTENDMVEEVVPRDVSTLLDMESWDDLTDAEVRLLIDYKVQVAVNSEENRAAREANAQAAGAVVAIAQRAYEESQAFRARIFEGSIMLQGVDSIE